jgi:hypothetical protein
VVLTVEHVYSGAGQVIGALCGDRKGQFPGGCLTYYAGGNPAGLANACMGGTAAGYLAAWADDWPKTLTFLDDALKH